MAREELSWQNLDVDTLPSGSKKALETVVSAEAAFRAALEKDLKAAKMMPEDMHLVISRKGADRIGVAFSANSGGGNKLSFKKK
jgi:hypothetical protein